MTDLSAHVATGHALWAIAANVVAALVGAAAGLVTRSGAISGALLGSIIAIGAGWGGWAVLLAGFFFASATSRLGWRRKISLGITEERGGRRSARNAFANTGTGAVAALVALTGPRELALVACAAALIAGASDTVASEVGKAFARRTWSLLPPRLAAPGTPGAVSIAGTLAGLASAAALAALANAAGVVPRDAVPEVIAGAFAGSLCESLLAATFEERGLLGNHTLNVLNTAVAAVVAVLLVEAAR